MATTSDSGFWPSHWGGAGPPCGNEDRQAEEGTDDETRPCLDLAAICDAFDTDDAEPLPERGDFWEPFEEEEQ